jgi:hypothetical protein
MSKNIDKMLKEEARIANAQADCRFLQISKQNAEWAQGDALRQTNRARQRGQQATKDEAAQMWEEHKTIRRARLQELYAQDAAREEARLRAMGKTLIADRD